MWSHVVFEHPATFDTLAMEETKKKQIMNDLITFTKSKDYYKKIGKAWKREERNIRATKLDGRKKEKTKASNKMQDKAAKIGTAEKTKMRLADAIANAKARLKIVVASVQDVEILSTWNVTNASLRLEVVGANREERDSGLRVFLYKALMSSFLKLLSVIEDIDCSLDLTGQRKEKEEKDGEGDGKDPVSNKKKEDEEKSNESILARNYLDLESHHLYETIGKLLEETKMSLADVAENLMPKFGDEDANACLANLIKAIEKAKEEVKVKEEEEEKERVKAEEEKKVKAEKEEKEKAEKEEKDKEKEQKSDETVKEKKTAGEEVKENGVKENGG
ncbi:hypothetical protein C3L33_18887, partial [Rhododendron williamsianum]